MAQRNLPACLAVTLPHEGGWSDHPKDPGGATMKGITLAVFRRWKPGATKTDLRAITPVQVEQIYRVDYWNPVRGEDLPAGVDLAVFDFGVNSGVSRSSKYLQALVGTKQDGVIATKTLAAVSTRQAVNVVQALCARRLSFVQGLKTFSTFGRGWSRRIADVEARGVKMALAASGPVRTGSVLGAEADIAKAKADAQNTATKAGGAAGAGSGVGLEAMDVNLWVIAGVVVVAAVVIALVKSRANINADRAAAYDKVAKEG